MGCSPCPYLTYSILENLTCPSMRSKKGSRSQYVHLKMYQWVKWWHYDMPWVYLQLSNQLVFWYLVELGIRETIVSAAFKDPALEADVPMTAAMLGWCYLRLRTFLYRYLLTYFLYLLLVYRLLLESTIDVMTSSRCVLLLIFDIYQHILIV